MMMDGTRLPRPTAAALDQDAAVAPRILVLGGAGFIGRHAVAALIARGLAPEIGSRDPARIGRRLPPEARHCRRRPAHFERLLRPEDWAPLLEGIDVVLNCVGILRQRGRETYDRVHHLAPAALAEACRRRGLRLVHVSALGLEAPARSGFLRSKRDGEAALRRSGANACIVRPSLLDAETGGYGAMWLRRVARWPVHAFPADAVGRIAALDVRDLGEALATLALRDTLAKDGMPTEFELGGDQALPLRDYLASLRRLHNPQPALALPIPGWLARLGSHVCDLLHLTPFSFGHWELLRRDNCPSENHLPQLLGRAPRRIGDPPLPAPAGQAAPVC
jgi:uncharacterized protein YbjT (DUF2867 family)